jgi:hypothetical protein
MCKLTKLQLVCAAVLVILGVNCASAFNPTRYKTTSKLASGKWVKISIVESGVYELTYDELREMGFSNPQNVKVYGNGGNRISETLNGSYPDDLVLVPILRTDNKICFYGNGPLAFSISDYATNPRYIRTFNPYSQVGCYMLTEESGTDRSPVQRPTVTVNNFVNLPTSLNYFAHERELASVSSSGKEMLGEDFANIHQMIDYYLPDLADSTVIVNTAVGASLSSVGYVTGILHSDGAIDTTSYSTSSSRIYVPANSYVFYNYASPVGPVKLTHPAEHGQFEPTLMSTAADFKMNMARLDYFIISYQRNNIINSATDNQFLMGYAMTTGNERFQLPGASDNVVVWNINNTKEPTNVTLTGYNDESGQGRAFFSNSASVSLYVAFDPTKTLKKVASYEPVANQNLHGMQVPDLLIITDKLFMEQAERLADLHRSIDGIDVAVVDQEQVFNEFTSGTRDGMAYRLLCKMLYDRNSTKFKNLLLFGTGTYDNRGMLGDHPGQLLTYQSDNSNYEDFTFTSDDFFGFLEDNSGSNVTGDRLSIGIGRITCADVDEARSDVDKIVEYYATPDYGVWRNNAVVVSDSPENGQYMFQGEGYKNIIDNERQTGMHVTTVHNTMYPRSTTEPDVTLQRKTATEARQLFSNTLKSGVYFATYVGHAGPTSMTKFNHLWVTRDVVTTSYPHLPIMSTACCDVAHYDSDSRGIAELMFHKRDGGAIALMTTSRMVYASHNDQINQYFLRALFSNAERGRMPTLGEAYKQSKLSYTNANTNKMSFFLLGDPAMKVNYPISLFNITKVNGTDVTNSSNMAEISPLMRFEVEAQVVDAQGNIDTNFNGDATVTLYDKEDMFTTLSFTINGVKMDRDIYFNREKLAEVDGRVVNGKFKGSVIVPRSVEANGETVQLRVYAHQDNSDYMVNGFARNITMLPHDESTSITDDQAPVITSMYINDEETFSNASVVGGTSVLYITAVDDQGLNMQPNSVDGGMTLSLDGGRPSYADISSYAESQNEGKGVAIEFPLTNLAEGLHTLTFTVHDMLGNSDTRTITFMVGQTTSATLIADKLPAYLDGEVNFDLETDLSQRPEVIVRVTDATGKLVWKTTTSSFPVTWDMKDMNGNKVPAGLYRYYGTYSDGSNYGGTPISRLIVLDPVKRAN